MNGRICQLCGKQLSRFAVGSDGDFCSREHRNQFRLRLGMDRLQEANKVASLMRRRENTKPIPAAQLATDCKVLPRVAPPFRLRVPNPSTLSILPLHAALETVRIAAASDDLMPPTLARIPLEGKRRELQSAVRFSALDPRPTIVPVALRMSAHLQPARAVRPGQASTLPSQRPRKVSTIGSRVSRTTSGANGIQLISVARPGIQNCQSAQRARVLAHCPDRGQDLRVSGGIGFRPPALRFRNVLLAMDLCAMLLPSGREMRRVMGSSRPTEAQVRSSAIPIPMSGLVTPTIKAPVSRTAFRWPSALQPGSRPAHQAVDSNRSCAVRWIPREAGPPRFQIAAGTCQFGVPESELRPSLPPMNSLQSLRRVQTVRFEPDEVPFQYTPSSLYGTLLGGTAAAPPQSVRKNEKQDISVIEDHFDSGLQRWLGGIDDWRVDVAGVRAGSLALFSPSIELSDYQFEFLARIENRSVTWVFRAAGFSDYYEATLTIVPGGGYELRRRVIAGGTPEAPTVKSVPPGSGKTTVTLRTRVAGPAFSISLDGQVIDTWNDLRLPSGGVGFLGAQDDRARLYWVKLLPSGNPSKEHLKQ